MIKRHLPRSPRLPRPARIGLAAGLALAVIAAAFLVGRGTAPADQGSAGDGLTATVQTPGPGTAHTALLAAMPTDVVQVLTTPAGPAWWSLIAAMMPDSGLNGLSLADSGADAVGYAFGVYQTQSPLARDMAPMFPAAVIQTRSVENAQATTDWINATDAASRRAFRDGTLVVIVPIWVDPAEELTLDTTSTTQALADTVGTEDTQAVWTFNIGLADTLLTQASRLSGDDLSRATSMMEALGLTDTTSITVTATTPDGTWTGAAQAMHLAKVNVPALSNLINGSSNVMAEQVAEDGTRFVVQSSGMSPLLSAAQFTAWQDGSPVASLGSAVANGQTLLSDNRTTALTGSIAPTVWATTIRGTQGDAFGPVAIEFAITTDGHVTIKPRTTGSPWANGDPAANPAANPAPDSAADPAADAPVTTSTDPAPATSPQN